MARPRDFDEIQVLDRALEAFWRKGYDGCSISDLVEATGLQRQSLYNVFTDKHGLFLAALDRYRVHALAALAPLEEPRAGLRELRTYMESVLAGQRAGNFGACLMVKTAFSTELGDARIRAAVEVTAGAVRVAFARVTERAMRRGELPKHTVPEAYAAYLYSVLNGLSALARTGGEAGVAAVLEQTFASKP